MRFKSKIEQAAAFLREEIARGRWVGEMPGKEELAIKLGVNSKTVGLALQLIEREGLIVSQGAGRRRKDLRMDVRRIAGYVASMPADAWIMTAATQEILEWFSRRDFPTLALFGQSNDVDVSFVGIDNQYFTPQP